MYVALLHLLQLP
jgi:hypothetical protein